MSIESFQGANHFLSNFHEDANGRTIEHAFQAAKTDDPDQQKHVLASATPGIAKRRGRKVNMRADWNTVRDDVMLGLLRLKFVDPVLRKQLVATGTQRLIEGNTWHDNYWGDCTCGRCKNIVGKNTLGRLLEQVRAEIIAEEASELSNKSGSSSGAE